MYIDTHCHLDFPTFDHDRRAVMRRARNADVSGMLIAGVQPRGWPVQRELQSRYDGIYWTAGLHPVYVAKVSREQLNDDIEALSQLLSCGHGPAVLVSLGLIGVLHHLIPWGSSAKHFASASPGPCL